MAQQIDNAKEEYREQLKYFYVNELIDPKPIEPFNQNH